MPAGDSNGVVRPAQAIEVFYQWTRELTTEAVADVCRHLDDRERARCSRFVDRDARRDYAAAHALVRHALAATGDRAAGEWRFVTNEHGKPSVVAGQAGSPPLTFNLSHTDGLVACAVSRGVALGVDVERHSRIEHVPVIAEHYFTDPEIAALRECPAGQYAARFTELWTLKEAYVKALGVGLSRVVDAAAFELTGDTALVWRHADGATTWQFWLADLGRDGRLAVAASGQPPAGGWPLRFHMVGDGPGVQRTRTSG